MKLTFFELKPTVLPVYAQIYTHIQRDSMYINWKKRTKQASFLNSRVSKRTIFNWEVCFSDYFFIEYTYLLKKFWVHLGLLVKIIWFYICRLPWPWNYQNIFPHWVLFQEYILDYNKYCHALVWWKLTTKYLWGSNYNQGSITCSKNWGRFKREAFRVYYSCQVKKKKWGKGADFFCLVKRTLQKGTIFFTLLGPMLDLILLCPKFY